MAKCEICSKEVKFGIEIGFFICYNLKNLIKSNPDYMINDFKELIEIVR